MSTPSPLPVELIALVDRLAAFFFLARQYGQVLHAVDALSTGERAILREVAAAGSRTVPELAARRAISRQAIQKSVDLLVRRGALVKDPSDTDRRTRRLAVTPAGWQLLDGITAREALEALQFRDAFSAGELAGFVDVLGRLEAQIAQRTRELAR